MRDWIRKSFRNRVFASVLLITLIPIFICNVLTLLIMVSRSNRELSEDGRRQIQACGDAMRDIYHQVLDISDDLSRGTVIHSALRNRSLNSRAVFQRLNQSTYFVRDYCQVDICLSDGQCAYTTGTAGQTDYNPGWGILRRASEAEGIVFGAGESGETLCAGRAVRDRSGTVLGYLVFTMTRDNIDDILQGHYSTSNDVYIMSDMWRMIYSSKSAIHSDMEEILRAEHLAGKKLTGGSYGQCRFFAEEGVITGFTILLRQPQTFALQVVNTFYGLNLFLTLTSLILCVGYAFWLSDHLARPVDKMEAVMSRISSGDLDAVIEVTREDEFGRLGESFNAMTARYKENLETSVSRQKELDETQIRMMQAQLNPHFLYNTLDSIKWMGITNHVPQIADIATNLAALLRASISGDDFITLEQELELIERYLEIQYIRFEDRFTCEIDVDWQYMHCLIPKLSLQPIVENAIIHGVADMEEGYIKVTSRAEGEDLILTVTDNGCGFPEEVMEKILHPAGMRPQRHLGLFNVHRILRLNYGAPYGISVKSETGQGSSVSLRLPVRYQRSTQQQTKGEMAYDESSDRR